MYALRCVEAWSMVIPWIGFSLAALLKRVEPTGQAKYVEFTTLKDPEQIPGQKGLLRRLARLALHRGAPARRGDAPADAAHGRHVRQGAAQPERRADPRVVPWKYGFKSAKSIVRIRLTDERAQDRLEQGGAAGVRLLLEREPRRRPSALEPGDRAAHRRVPPAPDPAVQRLRRPGGVALHAGWTSRRTTERVVPGAAASRSRSWSGSSAWRRWRRWPTGSGRTTSRRTRSSSSPDARGLGAAPAAGQPGHDAAAPAVRAELALTLRRLLGLFAFAYVVLHFARMDRARPLLRLAHDGRRHRQAALDHGGRGRAGVADPARRHVDHRDDQAPGRRARGGACIGSPTWRRCSAACTTSGWPRRC